jgi:hypothetical protein
MTTLLILLAITVSIQNIEYGTVNDIKDSKRIFVVADDDDARKTIVKMLSAYEGLSVVSNSKDAEIFLEYTTLTRDVTATRRDRSVALKSQMRVTLNKPDGTRVIAWSETETYKTNNGFVLGAPNEMNLTHHFVRDLQKARGEKPYSIRKLSKGARTDN